MPNQSPGFLEYILNNIAAGLATMRVATQTYLANTITDLGKWQMIFLVAIGHQLLLVADFGCYSSFSRSELWLVESFIWLWNRTGCSSD